VNTTSLTYCVYRCLYGEEFLRQSIESIAQYVDRIFIFFDTKPWGDVTSCVYKGEVVKFPEKFDNVVELGCELAAKNPKIEIQFDHMYNNIGQFTHLVNDRILPHHAKPDTLIVIEVDHIFRPDQIELALHEWSNLKNVQCATTRQVELWRSFAYRVPERAYRAGAVFWNLSALDRLPETNRQADIKKGMVHLNAFVHNVGFACSEKAMYWKHMIALAMSQKIGDSCPAESWYEEKWLKWSQETKNLEISKGYEHLIPSLVKYDTSELPLCLQRGHV